MLQPSKCNQSVGLSTGDGWLRKGWRKTLCSKLSHPTYDTILVLKCTPYFLKMCQKFFFFRDAAICGRAFKPWNGVSNEVLNSLFMELFKTQPDTDLKLNFVRVEGLACQTCREDLHLQLVYNSVIC